MLDYPSIDPVIFSIGPVAVHWYGAMYLVGFLFAWWLGRYRAAIPGSGWSKEDIDDLLFYGALGVVLGGRIGYVLFYSLERLADNPLYLFYFWEGGMSFHGGLIGVAVAMWYFAQNRKREFFQVTDFVAPLAPIGLGAGRIGNFINGELWGKTGDVPWAMRLPCDRFPWACNTSSDWPQFSPPLHPTQLYEALLEGAALFVILWFYSAAPRPTMAVSGLFLACYGVFRFLVEFVRVPDAHIGYLAFGWLTMGQLLTLPMLVGGLVLLFFAYRNTIEGK